MNAAEWRRRRLFFFFSFFFEVVCVCDIRERGKDDMKKTATHRHTDTHTHKKTAGQEDAEMKRRLDRYVCMYVQRHHLVQAQTTGILKF
ncbi:hypothetical protein QBC44DRAFT_337856 [Cladorrhinum sp. PSN332]|nr:hypothetical protein QBC44DRAFT_337856 [Cladorrhinum sp. PSN332]